MDEQWTEENIHIFNILSNGWSSQRTDRKTNTKGIGLISIYSPYFGDGIVISENQNVWLWISHARILSSSSSLPFINMVNSIVTYEEYKCGEDQA